MTLGLIWAQARNGVIGRDGDIPWHVPEDQARFKQITTGSAVIMGRRTWDSLPERFRPLPERRNIVVTRQAGWEAEGAAVAHSIEDALELARLGDIWVIGGAEIYEAALPHAEVLEVTEVDVAATGDAFAPELGHEWRRIASDPAEGWHDSRHGLRYRFLSYRRREPSSTLSSLK